MIPRLINPAVYLIFFISFSFQIAFHDLNPFPMRTINHKREHHYKVLEVSLKKGKHI